MGKTFQTYWNDNSHYGATRTLQPIFGPFAVTDLFGEATEPTGWPLARITGNQGKGFSGTAFSGAPREGASYQFGGAGDAVFRAHALADAVRFFMGLFRAGHCAYLGREALRGYGADV